ncbi:MAG: HAD family hydrolase [Candidatus Andersenbacteria bacterium]
MQVLRAPSRFIAWLTASLILGVVALFVHGGLQVVFILLTLLPLLALATRAALRRTPSIGQTIVIATALLLGAGAQQSAALVALIGAAFILLLDVALRTRTARFLATFPPPASLVRVERLSREERIPASAIQLHDRVLVLPGEHIPVDGRLISTSARVLLPGAPQHERKVAGEMLIAGTLAVSRLLVDAVYVGQETSMAILNQIANRVIRQLPPYVQRMELLLFGTQLVWSATVIAWWFFAADRTQVAWLALGGVWWLGSLLSRVAWVRLLVESGKRFLLLTTWQAVRRARQIKTAVLDKTGTLTSGAPGVLQVMTANNLAREDVLRVAAALEFTIDHPIARTIKQTVAAEHLTIPAAEHVVLKSGNGVEGEIEGERFAVGNLQLLTHWHLSLDEAMQRRAKLQESQGATVIYVLSDRQVLGALILKDVPRPSAQALVAGLRAAGVQQVHLVSGDSPLVVRAMAASLGIASSHAFAHTSAERKKAHVAQLPNLEVLALGDPRSDHAMLTQSGLGVGFLGAGPALREPALQILIRSTLLSELPWLLRRLRRLERLWWLTPLVSLLASGLAVTAVAVL